MIGIYNIPLPLPPYPFPPFSPSLINLMVSVDVKHRVYLLCYVQSPGEIKRREVSWTLKKKLAQKRSSAGRWCWARERVGLLLLKLFPNGGTTDIVSVTLFCIAVGTAMPDGHCLNILLFWRRSTAALVFRVGACFEVSLFYLPFPLVPVPNRPSFLRGR